MIHIERPVIDLCNNPDCFVFEVIESHRVILAGICTCRDSIRRIFATVNLAPGSIATSSPLLGTDGMSTCDSNDENSNSNGCNHALQNFDLNSFSLCVIVDHVIGSFCRAQNIKKVAGRFEDKATLFFTEAFHPHSANMQTPI